MFIRMEDGGGIPVSFGPSVFLACLPSTTVRLEKSLVKNCSCQQPLVETEA
jgi:hypothetical protein